MPYDPWRPPMREEEQPRKEKGRAFRRLLLVCAAALVVYGGVRLTLYAVDAVNAGQVSGELRRVYSGEETETRESETAAPEAPEETETIRAKTAEAETGPAETIPPEKGGAYPDNPHLAVSEEIQRLRRKNTDIVGWLEMDGLAEAVVQRDNVFYLTHDALGKRNYNGAVFLDMDISLTTRPHTLIMYGHNMKTGAMFGSLKEYRKAEYFYTHRFITFNSMYEDGRYIVFAAADVQLVNGSGHYVDLIGLLSADAEVRKRSLKQLCATALHGVVVDVSEEDQLLLLVTCTADDDERFVVAARRLRDGESEDRIWSKLILDMCRGKVIE